MKVWMKTFFLISLWIISLLANEDVELKMEACVEPANQSDFNFIMIVASYSYERKMMMSVSSECSQLVSCSVSRSRSILKTQTRGGHSHGHAGGTIIYKMNFMFDSTRPQSVCWAPRSAEHKFHPQWVGAACCSEECSSKMLNHWLTCRRPSFVNSLCRVGKRSM